MAETSLLKFPNPSKKWLPLLKFPHKRWLKYLHWNFPTRDGSNIFIETSQTQQKMTTFIEISPQEMAEISLLKFPTRDGSNIFIEISQSQQKMATFNDISPQEMAEISLLKFPHKRWLQYLHWNFPTRDGWNIFIEISPRHGWNIFLEISPQEMVETSLLKFKCKR